MKKLLISLLLLLIATAVVQAAIPTPPLADDSSLVLRLDFEAGSTVNSALTNYNFETGDSTGWTVEVSSSYAPSINWTYTGYEGNYAVKMQNTLGGEGTPRYGYIRQNITLDPYDYTLKFYVSYWCDYWSAHMGLRLKDGDTVVKQWIIKGGGSRKSSDWKLVEIDLRDLNLNGTKEFTVELFLEDNFDSNSGAANHGGWIAFDKIVVEQTVYYGVTQVNGRYGYGVSFDGSNDYVQVKNVDSELFNGSYTVSLWVSKADSATRGLLEIGGSASNCIRVYCYNLRCQWDLYSEEVGNLDFQAFPDYNVPVMLTFVYNSSTNTAKAYVNGVLKVSVDEDMRKASRSYIKISASHTNLWKGTVDEFRVYSRALSDSEIQQMYEALRVKFYDESSGEKIAANATVFNANHSVALTTDEVTKEAVLFNADLPAPGNYILQASSSNYYTRNFFVNLSSYQEKEYLLLSKSADAVLINFKLNDPTGTFQKPVLVIEKSEVQEREVTSDYFDVEQKVPTILMFNSRYFITVIDAESSTERKIGEFVASSSGDKYINVYSNIVPHSPLLDFTYDIYDANDSIVVQYNDTAKQTEYINVKIYNSTGYLVYNDTAAANDYALTYIKPNLNETYKVELHIKRVDQEILETKFLTGPDVAINIKDLIPPKDITGLDQDVALALGCLVIIILIAGLFSKKHSRLGALTVAFISAGLWFWGWLPVDQTIIISLLVIAVLAKFEEGYKGG